MDLLARECFGIYSGTSGKIDMISDLSSFNWFIRWAIRDFMQATFNEILTRTEINAVVDLTITPEQIHSVFPTADTDTDPRIYVVGQIKHRHACLIFTRGRDHHNTLISIAGRVLDQGLKPTISENINYFSHKMTEVQKIVDDTKGEMIDNIEKILDRDEKLTDLIDRSEHISRQTKQFVDTSRKLNKCCWLF